MREVWAVHIRTLKNCSKTENAASCPTARTRTHLPSHPFTRHQACSICHHPQARSCYSLVTCRLPAFPRLLPAPRYQFQVSSVST